MSGEMRAQERQPCRWRTGCAPDADPGVNCEGCNGDDTRWVTVGTLRPVEKHDDIAVLNVGDGPTSGAVQVVPSEQFQRRRSDYRPLYVIEEGS